MIKLDENTIKYVANAETLATVHTHTHVMFTK